MKEIYIIYPWTDLPLDKESKMVMNQDFRMYVKDHYYHFTDALADHIILDNADGTSHHWTTEQVRKAFEDNGLEKSERDTWGDIAYAANMAYADFYPKVLPTQGDCLKYAQASSLDIDGYEGKHFMRYISDLIGKGIILDWDAFI